MRPGRRRHRRTRGPWTHRHPRRDRSPNHAHRRLGHAAGAGHHPGLQQHPEWRLVARRHGARPVLSWRRLPPGRRLRRGPGLPLRRRMAGRMERLHSGHLHRQHQPLPRSAQWQRQLVRAGHQRLDQFGHRGLRYGPAIPRPLPAGDRCAGLHGCRGLQLRCGRHR